MREREREGQGESFAFEQNAYSSNAFKELHEGRRLISSLIGVLRHRRHTIRDDVNDSIATGTMYD